MSKFNTLVRVLKEDREILPQLVVDNLVRKKLLDWLPDAAFLKLRYWAIFHKKLNLNNPKTFNEKMQWLKLYDRDSRYVELVDKHLVKLYIKEQIGEQYVIPTLGKWDSVDQIDKDALPEQFVLKCNHDSGSVVICRDKSKFDWKKAEEKLTNKLKKGIFGFGREWPYKHVKPCIIAEAYMEDETQKNGLTDYKFYCFGGEPKFLYVSKGLEDHNTASISFLNMDWTLADFRRMDFAPLQECPTKPKTYDLMVQFAKQLSKGIPFLRVDMYEICGKLYFSELTFYPSSGFTPFVPEKWDEIIGSWIELPPNKRGGKKSEAMHNE